MAGIGGSKARRRRARAGLITVVLALLAAACAGGGETPADGEPTTGSNGAEDTGASAQDDVYEIGVVMPLTGGEATYGVDHIGGLQFAVQDIGEEYGLDLRLVVEDSQAEPRVAITAFEKLVEVDQVPVIVTSWSSVVTALGPLATDREVLLISAGAQSPAIAEAGDYARTMYPLADVDLRALARYTVEELDKQRAGIIYINNDSGRYSQEVYTEAFEAAGGEVVASESHEPQAIDFGAQIARLRQANPDVIHVHSLLTETPQIVSEIRAAGLDVQLTSYQAAEQAEMLERDAAEGLLYTVFAPDKTEPHISEYLGRWTEEYGREPEGASINYYMYDAVHIIAELIKLAQERGDDYTGAALLEGIKEQQRFDTPLVGQVVFEEDRTAKSPIYIRRIDTEAKEFVTVDVIDPE